MSSINLLSDDKDDLELNNGAFAGNNLNDIMQINHPCSFVFVMSSDEYQSYGILKGDYVVVRRDALPQSQDLVVIKYQGKFVLRHYAHPSEYLQKRADVKLYVPYDDKGRALFEMFGVISCTFRKMRRT